MIEKNGHPMPLTVFTGAFMFLTHYTPGILLNGAVISPYNFPYWNGFNVSSLLQCILGKFDKW